MTMILDAGAFIAIERGDRDMVALVKRERQAGRSPVTHWGVVAQIWRGGTGRQAPIARLLGGVEVKPLDDSLGRQAGNLLARSAKPDAIYSALICLARDGDEVFTSGAADLRDLARTAGVHVDLVPV